MNKRLLTLALVAVLAVPCMSACTNKEAVAVKLEDKETWTVGDVVIMGTYEQDAKVADGDEAIEWEVCAVDEEGNKAFLISKYALEAMPFHDETGDVTWETCSLRTWLNDTFYDKAFTESEQARILTTSVTPDENPEGYKVNYGHPTEDKIFILNYTEAKEAEAVRGHLSGKATAYAGVIGNYKKDNQKYGHPFIYNCWLRTTGADNRSVMYSYEDDKVKFEGQNVSIADGGVAPALWISIE